MVAATSDEVLTFEEIATRLKVTPGTVWRWVRKGVKSSGDTQRLLAFKAGGFYRVHATDLDDFLRRLNPDTWRQLALQQEKARREARKDRKRLHDALGAK